MEGFYNIKIHTHKSDHEVKEVLRYQNVKRFFVIPTGEDTCGLEGIPFEKGRGDLKVELKYKKHEQGAYQVILERITKS